MTLEEVTKEVVSLHDQISEPVDQSNPLAVLDAMMRCSGWLARAGVLVEEAKYHKIRAEGEAAHFLSEQKLPQDRERRRIEFLTAGESRMHGLAARLYDTIKQQIDIYRSALSYAKESMHL